MAPTSYTGSHPADDHRQLDPPLGQQDTNQRDSMSRAATQKENESNPNNQSTQRAESRHPSKHETSEQRPTRPFHGTTRGEMRMQTAKTSMTRQRTGMSRQQTAFSKIPSRPNEENLKQQAINPQEAEVDPDYYELNPWYGQRNEEPIFGLNKPLPHTVRGGMRRRRQAQDDHEEDEIETARSYHDPGRKPDLERGEGDCLSQQGSDDDDGNDDRRNKHGRDAQKPARTSRSYNADYFDQTPDPSRTDHEVDFPVMPSGEEWIEKDEAPTVFRGQTRLWQNSRAGQRRAQTRLSSSSTPRDLTGPPPKAENEGPQESSPDENLRESRHLPRSRKDPCENEDFEFDSEEKQEVMDLDELQLEYNQHRNLVARIRASCPQVLAEFWGTAIAVCIGLSVNLSVKVSQGQTNKFGQYENQCWGWGLAFMIGIYLSAGISGGHLNPVITIVFCIFRGFPVKKLCAYVPAQLLGGFVGAWFAYGVYSEALHAADPEHHGNMTGTAFYPGPNSAIEMSPTTAFFSEFLASAILMGTVLALGDDQNAPPGAGLGPVIVGLVVVALMMAFGYNTGPTLSPARDLGPRGVAKVMGYEEAFANSFSWYGAWLATILGGIIGALFYDAFVFRGTESPVNMTAKQNWHSIKRRCAQMRYNWGKLCQFCLCCCGRGKSDLTHDEGKFGSLARVCSNTKLAATKEAQAVHDLAKGDQRKFKAKTKQNGVRIIYGGLTAH